MRANAVHMTMKCAHAERVVSRDCETPAFKRSSACGAIHVDSAYVCYDVSIRAFNSKRTAFLRTNLSYGPGHFPETSSQKSERSLL